MTVTIRITVSEEEYQEAKREAEEFNNDEYTREMYMEDCLEYFYEDCRDYCRQADVNIQMV